MTRRQAWILALIVLLAVAVRLAYHVEIRDYVLYRVPLIDAQEYVEWAGRLATGTPEHPDVYYKAPLYPWVLGASMRVLGVEVTTAYVLNAVLGLLNVLLVAIWARRVAGARFALVGAAIAAVYGPFLYFEGQAMPTTLGLTLALLSLLALSAGAGRPGVPALVGAGVCTGLLALARPSFLLWLPVSVGWILARCPGRRLRNALLLVLPALVAILPVTVRNRAVGGSWVLISANGGINFFLGNNADAARTSVMRPGLEWEELVTALPAEERQGQARWDRWFASQAWRWVRTQPLGFVAGLGRKALQYVNAHEIDRNLDARGFRSRSRVLRLAPRSAWLAPWILLGIAVAWRRGGVGRLVVLFWVSGFAATVLVFVTERYKVDAAPAAIPLALLGASEVVAHLRRGVARHLAQPSSTAEARLAPRIVVMLLVLGAVLAFNDLIGIRTVQPAHASVLEGVAYYKEGRINRAVERLREALEESPGDANAHYQLGTALEKQNRLRAAQVEYEAAGRLVPGNPKPPLAAGWVARRLGERWEARERYDRASRLDPHNALIHLEMGTLLEELGEVEAARERYRQALALAVDPHVRREASRRLERPGWDRPPPPQPPSGQAPRRGADRRSP